jgi:hypothetical protein
LVPTSDGGDDLVWILGPVKGLGIIVGLGEEAVDERRSVVAIARSMRDALIQIKVGKPARRYNNIN